jgi:Ca-activated chloride channel family protein
MLLKPSALAVLALLCFACNNTGNSSGKEQTNDVSVMEYARPVAGNDKNDLATNNENLQNGIISKDEKQATADSVSEYMNTEEYDNIVENSFASPLRQPLSTFSIDVDAASYSNIRRYLNSGSLPPRGAIRLEEMINYFDYNYPQPINDQPFSVNTEIANCPWNPRHQLIHIGLQGEQIPSVNLPPANLVFLVDVSGSMDEENKLPLVKTSLRMLVQQLKEKDRVAIVVYAGNAGLVLPSTPGGNKQKILEAIDALEAGGSTAGGEGIALAYKIAKDNFIKEGNNRVILATDGDFNVGPSSEDDLVKMIEKERSSGVFLSVLGYGVGNYKDNKMQQLADKGNGNHYYIDTEKEAQKVLVSEMGGTLFAIAKDVKIQVEFNPAQVQAYRLLGYENRVMAAEDFNDDRKDAGELGSGHRVTALYEIIPVGVKDSFTRKVDDLKYQVVNRTSATTVSNEWMTIKLRYKKPDENTSRLIEQKLEGSPVSLDNASDNLRFSAAVAEFGLLLRTSDYRQGASYEQVLKLAKSALGADTNGYRSEFIKLVETSVSLASR